MNRRFETEAGGSSRRTWRRTWAGSRKRWKVYLRGFCVCVCMCKMYALKTSKEDVTFIWGEGRKALVIPIGLKAHKSHSLLPPPIPPGSEKLREESTLTQSFEKSLNKTKQPQHPLAEQQGSCENCSVSQSLELDLSGSLHLESLCARALGKTSLLLFLSQRSAAP